MVEAAHENSVMRPGRLSAYTLARNSASASIARRASSLPASPGRERAELASRSGNTRNGEHTVPAGCISSTRMRCHCSGLSSYSTFEEDRNGGAGTVMDGIAPHAWRQRFTSSPRSGEIRCRNLSLRRQRPGSPPATGSASCAARFPACDPCGTFRNVVFSLLTCTGFFQIADPTGWQWLLGAQRLPAPSRAKTSMPTKQQ
jgi:hypothetical protein